MSDSKQRFSDRVDNYVRYRPGYPVEAIDFLYERLGFGEAESIADIGAGTGIFTKLLLERGSSVVAVEPNPDMRRAAEAALSSYERYRSTDGSAEETSLADDAVDGIVSAQAFHWFDIPRVKREFGRILKPGGYTALVWNRRLTDTDDFAVEYDASLKRYGHDYEKVNHKNIQHEHFVSFFKEGEYEKAVFRHRQPYDLEGLKGRTLSSSYCPLPGEANYEPLMAALDELFARTSRDGFIAFEYETEVFYGQV
ncbi:class I SAM-dependent methyltransferase [Paenibacillus sp.]|uniref:class I SAM-dependent methyltransferase n=1 Tax=Paenibacillus sp. TaxID=58172 RepID=UPI002812008A|nr:class I SAM-dependent methyltransferase [Paenibacillus sp.]